MIDYSRVPVFVVGSPSGGTTAVAATLHNMGVWMGDCLTSCGMEQYPFNTLLPRAFGEGGAPTIFSYHAAERSLAHHIQRGLREVKSRGWLRAGIKFPGLAEQPQMIKAASPAHYTVVVVSRNTADVHKSIERRDGLSWRISAEKVKQVAERLSRAAADAEKHHIEVVRVQYERLMDKTEETVSRLADDLGLPYLPPGFAERLKRDILIRPQYRGPDSAGPQPSIMMEHLHGSGGTD